MNKKGIHKIGFRILKIRCYIYEVLEIYCLFVVLSLRLMLLFWKTRNNSDEIGKNWCNVYTTFKSFIVFIFFKRSLAVALKTTVRNL